MLCMLSVMTCPYAIASCQGETIYVNVKHGLTRLERWNGSYYERVAMANLGLFIQLGHPLDLECVNPEAAHKSFTVIHSNGIHMVNVRFCNCEHRVSHRVQILHAN